MIFTFNVNVDFSLHFAFRQNYLDRLCDGNQRIWWFSRAIGYMWYFNFTFLGIINIFGLHLRMQRSDRLRLVHQQSDSVRKKRFNDFEAFRKKKTKWFLNFSDNWKCNIVFRFEIKKLHNISVSSIDSFRNRKISMKTLRNLIALKFSAFCLV